MPGAALGIAQPNINPMGYFNASQAQAQQEKAMALEQKRKGYEGLYIAAAGLMRDGEVKPEEWEQFLDVSGMDPQIVEQLRGKPHLAQILASGSAAAIAVGNDERMLDMKGQELELALQKAMAGPDPTSDQREYEMAVKQGYQGTFMDYQQELRRAGATNVNVGGEGQRMGTIPPGMAAVPDPSNPSGFRMERIPGGPAAEEAAAAEAAAAAQDAGNTVKTNIVTEDVNRALDIIGKDPFWTTGLVGGWLKQIGGTGARDVGALIDTVKANSGFAQLQAMRSESKTGAALGQVTEKELAFLQATLGNLDQEQRPEQLEYNLKRVAAAFMDIIHGPGNWSEEDMSGGGQGGASTFTTSGGIEYSF